MDFTQYNKINSGPPPTKSCTDRYLKNYDSRNFQSTNFLYQPQIPPVQFQSKPIIHPSFNSYNSPASSSTLSSNCTDQCFVGHHQTPPTNEIDDFDIEYFQCIPPPEKSKIVKNPFRPIIDSMRRFNPVNQKPHGIGDAINHQTYICSHNDESNCYVDESSSIENEEMIDKSYKSFTKIVSIPNGVKIITEIKKEDNCGKTDCIECRKKIHSDENWLDKQIEVTLSEGDQSQGEEEGGNNLIDM